MSAGRRVSIELHGSSVSRQDAAKAADAALQLLHVVSATVAPKVDWAVADISFKCDGCGLRRPDRPTAGERWTYRDGDDYCPHCGAWSVSGE